MAQVGAIEGVIYTSMQAIAAGGIYSQPFKSVMHLAPSDFKPTRRPFLHRQPPSLLGLIVQNDWLSL